MNVLVMTLLCAPAAVAGQSGFVPARYVAGRLPAAPVSAVSAGQVFLEVTVGADGRVTTIDSVRSTPPFTEAVIDAVRGWRFDPALDRNQPVSSTVFVAGVFAAPALIGPTPGEPPRDLRPMSNDVPAPTSVHEAAYPPLALGDGAVLVEMTIDGARGLTGASVQRSSPAFDAVALAAAQSWSFVPARKNGQLVTTLAYVVFGFRPPIGR